MVRSKLPVIVSLVSLLVAVAAIVTLFSLRNARSGSDLRLSATSYVGDDPILSQPAMPILPDMLDYRQVLEIPLDFKKPMVMAVDADDRIYVAGDTSLCRFSPQGKLENRIPLGNGTLAAQPTCITVANRHHLEPGRIYVGFTDHVEKFAPDGTALGVLGLGLEKAQFTSLSTSENYIFIADAGQNVVQRFDWTGKLLEPFGESSPGHFTAPVDGSNASFDLAVGLDDLVYVVNRREHRVEGYDFQGGLERHWGQGSPDIKDFAGASSPAHLAIMTDGRFVTGEEAPLRVKVYARPHHGGAVTLDGVVCGPEAKLDSRAAESRHVEGDAPLETVPVKSVTGLAADSRHRVLVLDSQARCVRVFEAIRRLPLGKK